MFGSRRSRSPFYRNAALWLTAVMVGVVSVAMSMLGIYIPEVAAEIGYGWVIVFVLVIVTVGIAVHRYSIRSFEQSVLFPLQRIEDVTEAIAVGAVSGRIELDHQAMLEAVRVAEAINRLAQKATHDIAEMQRLEQVRSEFVGNVSHELRTPIFSVQGYLETLLDGAADDPDVSRKFLEKAYQNALRLNALLNDLIDISRIESGELQFSFRYFNVLDLLNEIVGTMEIRGTQRNVSLSLDVPEHEELIVYADKERLVQVMTNLVDNAIKYNRDGGSVVVTAERIKSVVQITVQDTGIGIPDASKDRIFERFYRVDKDRSRAVGGTGLGLAIVKHILEAHDAPLSVSSEYGKGTSISFSLKGA